MWVLKFTCISYLNWCFQVAFVSKLCFQVRFYRLVRQTLPINNPRGSFEIVPTCDITLIQLYNNQMMLSFLIILHLVVSHQWHQDRCCNKLLLLPDCPAVRWTQIGLTWFWIEKNSRIIYFTAIQWSQFKILYRRSCPARASAADGPRWWERRTVS